MQFFTWQDIASGSPLLPNPSVLCIGAFDGPHKGHGTLFEGVLNYSRQHCLSSGVITFSTPPKAVTDAAHFSGCISTLEQKKEFFTAAGFDFLVVIDFTEDIKKMDGIVFLETVRKAFDIHCLFSGQDFRCGYRAATGVEQISEFCTLHQMEYSVITDTKAYDDEKISSTLIRQCIAAGDFAMANKLLGYQWSFDLRGVSVNKSYTLDISSVNQVVPEPGVYNCLVNGEIPAKLTITEKSMAFVDTPLTFMQNFVNIVFV